MDPSPGPSEAALAWLQTGANGPLVLVLLLMGWLWMLVRRRESDTPERRLRPAPMSLDKLGRAAFLAALNRDQQMWRDLFVNGAEARTLLSDGAATFLEARTPAVLDSVLHSVVAEVRSGSIYGGVETDASGGHALRVTLPDGGVALAPIGHTVQVGPAWRLWGGRPEMFGVEMDRTQR
jgi:hypothetical protein